MEDEYVWAQLAAFLESLHPTLTVAALSLIERDLAVRAHDQTVPLRGEIAAGVVAMSAAEESATP